MNLVVIYGPPGVGKLTTARELSRLTGYKLFDNHASIDVIRRVFDFGDEPFWPLVNRIRFDVIEQAAKRDVSLVFTCAYVHPEDRDHIEKFFVLAESHGGRVCLVQLICEMQVLEQRVQSESGAPTKCTRSRSRVLTWQSATTSRPSPAATASLWTTRISSRKTQRDASSRTSRCRSWRKAEES